MGAGKKIFSGVLSALLAFIFISMGLMQLTPKISEELHKRLFSEFKRFSKVHPAVKFGYQIDPLKFMPQIGVIEIVCGTFLVIGPRITKVIGSLLLASIVVGVMYFKYILNDPLEQLIAFGVVLFLLFIRLNLYVSSNVVVKTRSEDVKKESKKEN